MLADPKQPPIFFKWDGGTEPYSWLSNFQPTPLSDFPSVEHAYQTLKVSCSKDINAVRNVLEAPTAAEAYQAARRIILTTEQSAEWEKKKSEIMWQLLVAKFTAQDLRLSLLRTYPRPLIFNTKDTGDDYWGDGKHGTGRNILGQQLETLRLAIRNGDIE